LLLQAQSYQRVEPPIKSHEGTDILFAKLYHDTGLMESGSQRDVSPVDAIYFSIVTWTTLGYGDLSPAPDIRIYASLEALLGYIYMAIAVGVTVNLLETLGQANRPMQQDGASPRPRSARR
jgi:hypothetical protein